LTRQAAISKAMTGAALGTLATFEVASTIKTFRNKDINGSDKAVAAGESTAVILGGAIGAIGGPMGVAIGAGLAKGLSEIAKTIGDWATGPDPRLGKDESPSTLGKMDRETYYDNLSRISKGLKPILPADIEKAFTKSTTAIKSSEEFGKQTKTLSNQYVGGDVPLEERKKLVPKALETMNATDSSLKELQAIPI